MQTDTAKKLANCESEMSPRIWGFVICGLIIKVYMPSFEYVAGRAPLQFYNNLWGTGTE